MKDNNIFLESKENESNNQNDFFTNQKEEKSEKRSSMERSPIKIILWGLFRPVIVILISIVIVAVGIDIGAKYLFNNYLSPVDMNDSANEEVVVENGMSLSDISELLYDKGIIRDKTVFKYYVDFSDMSSELQAGTYELSKDMTMDDIIDTLKKGNGNSEEIQVMFPEGSTVKTITQTLKDKKVLTDDANFLKQCQSGSGYSSYYFVKQVVDQLKESGQERKYLLEGYLFPDTYRIYADSSESEIIKKMLNRFNEIFSNDYLNRADEMDMTVDQVITLASLIEREGKTQDFKKISAVFHNRLDAGMRLDSCATLQYITGETKYVFSDEEKEIDSDYNTYKYKGLPAGPICNPGKKAIEAALYPDEEYVKDDYRYFCLAEPDSGELIFSRTLKEHNANVKKYQQSWIEYDEKNNR